MELTDGQMLSGSFEYHPSSLTSYDRVAQTFGGNRLRNLGIPPGKILDIGCSTGLTTVEIASLLGPQYQIQGIDIQKSVIGTRGNEAIERYNSQSRLNPRLSAVSKSQVNFEVGDGYKPAYTPDTFSAVFAMNNFWFQFVKDTGMSLEMKKEIMKRVESVIKPGGFFLISRNTERISEPGIGLVFEKLATQPYDMKLTYSTTDKRGSLFTNDPMICSQIDTISAIVM